jgi:hypothetical protein
MILNALTCSSEYYPHIYRDHISTTLDPILSQMNPIHALIPSTDIPKYKPGINEFTLQGIT